MKSRTYGETCQAIINLGKKLLDDIEEVNFKKIGEFVGVGEVTL